MTQEGYRTLQILLVEESAIHTALIQDLLAHSEPNSYTLTAVHSLHDAECVLASDAETFDVVLLDLVLPDCQGIDALHRIRAVAPHLPMVIVTNIDDKAVAYEAVQHGAQDFLVKGGFNNLLLARTIRYAIERHRIQEQLRDEKQRVVEQHRNIAQLCVQLEDANDELKRLDTIKGNFLSTVSHELRTPLTIIKGALSNLADGIIGQLTEKQQRIVDISHRNIDRLARLINDLLDLSRLESGRTFVHPRKMNALPVLRQITHDMQDRAMEQNMALMVEFPESLPDLFADGDLVAQVMNNVLANAMRYAKNHVVVRACVEENDVFLSISDDGPGIQEKYHEKIFNKFEQVNRPNGGAGYKGTGLGLAICKEIMLHHNGDIWVESDGQSGSTFHCRFPRYDEQAIVRATVSDGIARAQRIDTPLCVLNMKIVNIDELREQCDPATLQETLLDMKEHMLERALRQNDRVTACVDGGFFIIEAQVTKDGGRALKERLLKIMQQYMLETALADVRPKLSIGMAMCPDDGIDPDELVRKTMQTLEQPKVLVIDDEQAVLDMLSMLLQTTDFDVELAHDGKQGLEKVYSYDPDVIVLDVIMPEMDGWEVCQRLRADERTKDKPIYMLTASSGSDLEERAAMYGAKLMHKPYDNQQIISLLRDATIVH